MLIWNKIRVKNHWLRVYLPLLLCVFLSTAVNAQRSVTVADYLHTIRESGQLKGNDYKLSFLKEFNYRLPLIKGVQLRTETRDFLFNRQEYSVRILPNSLGAVSKQNGLYRNKLEFAMLETDLHFNEQLEKGICK